MPMIQITMLSGLTDVMVEETGTVREGVAVAFYEVSKESYARGGVLISDK
jgi:phenylpyruvate tautomerase PptA (4-oxalocrotonate tautomerase family)